MEWAQKDRDWFMSLTPHTQHKVCRQLWRAKIALLPWRRGGEMVGFWEGVVERLAPDVTGNEGEEEVRAMRSGCAALARVLWDLRSDKDHPLAWALAGRAGLLPSEATTFPHRWVSRAEQWLEGRRNELRVLEREVREAADEAWRMEAVRAILRGRQRGERVIYREAAEQMNARPGSRHRPRLTAGGGRRAFKRYHDEIMDESEFYLSSDGEDWSL